MAKRKGSSSNHHFLGAILIFKGVHEIYTYTPNMYFHQVHISDIDTMFMIYSVVNEILVMFVVCLLLTSFQICDLAFRPEGSLRSSRAQVWCFGEMDG